MNKKVSIIIVNYSGLGFLKKCILSIKKQTYKNIEVIVVDNNSSDDSIAFLRKNNSEIIIIQNKENFGFAKGNNIGAKKAAGQYLFFLNNDTELFPDAVEKLVYLYQPNSILSAFQISTREKKTPGHAGDAMDIFGYPYHDDDTSETKIFYADGVALFIKKSDFFKLGMFDEKLFMFQEDIDLSWRAQLLGYNIIACQEAKLYHYYGGTASLDVNKSNQYITSYFRRYLNEKNVIRNIIKNYSLFTISLIIPILILFHLFEMSAFILTGKIKAAGCYLQAYWWNISNLKDTLRLRQQIQNRRVISDREIMTRMYWHYSKLKLFLKMGLPEFK